MRLRPRTAMARLSTFARLLASVASWQILQRTGRRLRRRRWTTSTVAQPALALRHGVNANLLRKWVAGQQRQQRTDADALNLAVLLPSAVNM